MTSPVRGSTPPALEVHNGHLAAPVIRQTRGERPDPAVTHAPAIAHDHMAPQPPSPTAGIPPVHGQKPTVARWIAKWVPPQLVLTTQQALSYAGVGALASGAKLMAAGTPAPYLIDTHYIERMPHVALVGFCLGMLMNGMRLPDELLKLVPAEHRHHFAGVLTDEEKKLSAAKQMAILSYRAGLIGEFIFTKMRWKEELLPFIHNPKDRGALDFLCLRRSGQAIALGGELLVTTIYVPILFKLGIGLDISWSTAALAGFDIGLFGSYIATLINLSSTPATQPEANLERQKNFGILNSLATTAALFPREIGLWFLLAASGIRYALVFNNREKLRARLSPAPATTEVASSVAAK